MMVFENVCYRCLLYRRDRLSAAATSVKPKTCLRVYMLLISRALCRHSNLYHMMLSLYLLLLL